MALAKRKVETNLPAEGAVCQNKSCNIKIKAVLSYFSLGWCYVILNLNENIRNYISINKFFRVYSHLSFRAAEQTAFRAINVKE